MDYLFPKWALVSKRLSRARRPLFLFDVDGTLAPIAPRPGKARVSRRVQRLVRLLSKKYRGGVGVISGRTLREAKRMVGCRGLMYAGNHGMEIEVQGRKFIHPGARSKAVLLPELLKRVRRRLGHVPGVLIENKNLSLSVHHRLVRKGVVRTLRKGVEKIMSEQGTSRFFKVSDGKKVLEIRPRVDWNKGSAVVWFRKAMPKRGCVFYIGDDATDEDAFRALRKKDVGVRIGRRRGSKASFYLKSQGEVPRLLEELVKP